MLQVDAEAWAYRLIRDAESKRRVEDNLAELKRIWPDARDVARQLAGHANAAWGEPILWLFGIDEHSGVVPYETRNMADWRPQLEAEFEGVAPPMQHFALRWKDQPFEALVFRTDAPPYVVKHPNRHGGGPARFEFDVPWREGRTRSARRAELILMLRPSALTPTFEVLGATVGLRKTGEFDIAAYIYVETVSLRRVLIRRTAVTVDFGDESVEVPGQVFPDGQDPDVVLTRSHLRIDGAGKVLTSASGTVRGPQLPIPTSVSVTVMYAVAGVARPVGTTFAIPRGRLDGSTTDAVSIWRVGDF